MRIIICDDDPLYRRALHEKILQDSFLHDYEVDIAEYGNGEELLAAVDGGESADVFFLDVQMEPGVDGGIGVARELRGRWEKGLIVYVTGFIDYVQTGYEVKAFRYLLKSQLPEGLPKVLGDIRRELSGESYFFHIAGETVRTDRQKILYLESRGRLLHMVTTQGEYNFYGNLENAAKELGESFLRCHRSFLVNVGHIRRHSAGRIVLEGDIAVPVSRSYAKDVKRKLMLDFIN